MNKIGKAVKLFRCRKAMASANGTEIKHRRVDDMKAKLRHRFRRFIQTLEGFEDIDELMSGTASETRRAEYFLKERTIIIEQKALTTNPEHKVQKYADRLLGEGQFTANGRHSLYPVFESISGEVDHHRQLLNDLSKVLEVDISDGDKQLRDTRKAFSVPAAMGVVVLLNESAVALDPRLTSVRINNLLAEKTGSSAARFPNTDLVVTITDTHVLSAALPYRRMSFHVSPTSTDQEAAFSTAKYLKDRWIGFTGEIYVGLVRPPSPKQIAKLYGGLQ